jgi:hypothetical protein
MHIEKLTQRPKKEVKVQVDRRIRELKSPQERKGFSVDLVANWRGEKVDLALRVQKGWLSGTFMGTLVIEEDRVRFDCTVPPLLQGFLGEHQIREFLQRELDGLVD